MIVNWLVTRKCNKRCSFCGIVHEPKNKNLKRIADINKDERSFTKILSNIKAMNKVHDIKKVFHIFYGGEPFLKKGFLTFIKKINKIKGLNYTVITNGSLPDEVVKIFEKAGKYKGLTVSLDPLVMETANKSNEIKNNNALEILKLNQKLNLTDDMVVECMFDKNNIRYYRKFLKMMNVEFPEVKISISFYDYPKNEEYDFALNDTATKEYIKSMRLYPKDKSVVKLFDEICFNEHNIHMKESPLFMRNIHQTCDSSNKCGLIKAPVGNKIEDVIPFKTLTVDADGEFRLCLRIAGNVKMNIDDIYNNKLGRDKIRIKMIELLVALTREYNSKCEGCSWTCPLMDDHWDEACDVTHAQNK